VARRACWSASDRYELLITVGGLGGDFQSNRSANKFSVQLVAEF